MPNTKQCQLNMHPVKKSNTNSESLELVMIIKLQQLTI